VAFTSGRDVFFSSGAFRPDSSEGLRLLAHEAAHAVQQAAGPVPGKLSPGGVFVSNPTDAYEQAAERAAQRIELGAPQAAAGQAPGLSIQRCGRPGGCGRAEDDFPSVASDGVIDEEAVGDGLDLAVDGTGDPLTVQRVPATPSSIEVVTNHQFPITAPLIAHGVRTGCGGISEMKVSDAAGTSFDGSSVSEDFIGQGGDVGPAFGGCNNASGQGGAAGSTFTVGSAASYTHPPTGFSFSLPAKPNTFYDVHVKIFFTNVLPAGVAAQTSECVQQYTSGGAVIGGKVFNRRHHITRQTVAGQDAANVDLTK
jgi:hypothetical protein